MREEVLAMLKYEFDQDVIQIRETANEEDVEFHIHILEEQYLKDMKEIQREFEDNRVYTDVLFYIYANHEYQVIVRKDHYTAFVLELMKHRLLRSVEWAN